MTLLLLACLTGVADTGRRLLLPRWPVYALAVCMVSLALQTLLGQQLFLGDAAVAALYLGVALVAVAMGTAAVRPEGDGTFPGLRALALATLAAALVSVGIALSQWTQTYAITLGLVSVDLPPGARPFANLGQANHFNTAAFLGICSLVLLYETRAVGRVGLWLAGTWLLLGMAASGSRTAWLQLALGVGVVWLLGQRVQARLRLRSAVAGVLVFAALTLAWPWVNDVMLLSGGRPVTEGLARGGVRLTLWWSLLDAIAQQPLLGYGWLQTALAQQSTALAHPPVGYLFEQAHNLVLDLWIWAGVPLGSAALLCLVLALVAQFKALRDPRAACLMAGVLGLLAHAMVEQPLHHAYFLIPFCLALGAMHALCPTPAPFRAEAKVLVSVATLLLALLAVVAADYLKAEESFRQLRMESARIGLMQTPSAEPDLLVLDQLQAFQWFARNEARRGMSAADLARMRDVAHRYPQPPVLMRQALAAGLNGDSAGAARSLALICRMHNTARCDEARQSWSALQRQHPKLLGVALP